MKPTGPQKLRANHFWISNPAFEGLAAGLGNLKTNRLDGLALGNRGAFLVSEPYLANAEVIPFVFGWSPGGDAPVNSGICGSLGATFWSINHAAWPGDFPNPVDPVASMRLGETYVLRFQNETKNDHPIHLHGMTFRLLRSNKRSLLPLWTDTALLRAQETIDGAVVADNPGDWMFHCHVIEHQKTGLSGFIRVT